MLELNQVTRKFSSKLAVNNVSLTIEPGKTYALLGPNGSGKTTMMKMIAGLMRPTSGEILFEGQKIGPKTKADIAYMSTESYFYGYMSIRDAGKYYHDFFRDFDMEKYMATLERMELNPHDKIAQLSSGMNAKVRLALTLSRSAKLLMFDEPLNGVDILTRAQVISEIVRNRAEGRSMMISTHLVEEMDSYIDHVIFMKNGEIIRQGSREELEGEKTLTELYMDLFLPEETKKMIAGFSPEVLAQIAAAAAASAKEEVKQDA